MTSGSSGARHAWMNDASTARRKSFGGLDRQWTSSVRPFERLGHRAIEILDELKSVAADPPPS
jgi:hypothetical protein